jgi:hypothetical protein
MSIKMRNDLPAIVSNVSAEIVGRFLHFILESILQKMKTS